MLGPSEVAVARANRDVAVAEVGQRFACSCRKRRDNLDRVHAVGEHAEHRGLVARPRANLQHAMVRLDVQRLCHEGNDVGLGDGLVVPYRQG
jgi:hypothetical protein